MRLIMSHEVLQTIQEHGLQCYPEEGAGLILGEISADGRLARRILFQENRFEPQSRHNRYLIEPKEILKAEQEAERLGLEIIGIFHSHPDHPAEPSEFDRQWALPWYSYLITRVTAEGSLESKSWRLDENREAFSQEFLELTQTNPTKELK